MSRASRKAELENMTDTSGVKIPKIELSMRWSIVSLLTLLILFSAGLIILVSYLGGRQSTQFLIDTLMEDKAYRFIDKASQFLAEAKTLAGDARESTTKLNVYAQRSQVEEALKGIFEHQPHFSAAYLIRGGKALIAHHEAIPGAQTQNLLEEISDTGSEAISFSGVRCLQVGLLRPIRTVPREDVHSTGLGGRVVRLVSAHADRIPPGATAPMVKP